MKFKLLACNVFEHETAYCAAHVATQIDADFLEIGEHAHPATLRVKLQEKIDAIAAAEPQYDAIIMAYGLCGRSIDGLTAKREILVIPRSHDCGGILLGSRKKFEEHFRDMPSTPFSSPGYVEHGHYYFQDGEIGSGDELESLIRQYGKDNGRYIYDAMRPTLDGKLQPVYYIDTPELSFPQLKARCQSQAEKDGREFRVLSGDLRLLKMLLGGDWPENEFLLVKPGESIRMTPDQEKIIEVNNL